MKRGVYAALGPSVIAGGPVAHAAPGSLVVNGTAYREPSGCVQIDVGAAPLAIENHTDAIVTVFYTVGCGGQAGAALPSGGSRPLAGSAIRIS
ncbi:hypothetical protein ACW2Q0_21500 [Nocardia sp. R16R-3T]